MIAGLLTVIDRLFALAGAFIFSQIPLFIHQYAMNLQGHAEELNVQINKLSAIANLQGKTITAYIQKFTSSSDSDFSQQGMWMQSMIERYDMFTHTLALLDNANIWTKPFIFFYHVHADIAYSTLHAFLPGIPFSLEGILYCFIGMCVGLCAFRVFSLGYSMLKDVSVN